MTDARERAREIVCKYVRGRHPEDTHAEMIDEIAEALSERPSAYVEGYRAGVEKAAQLVLDHDDGETYPPKVARRFEAIAKAIRALPIPTEEAKAEPAKLETTAEDDPRFLRGTSEDPRLIAAGYVVCGSGANTEWHWQAPGGIWHDRYKSEEAAAKDALSHLLDARRMAELRHAAAEWATSWRGSGPERGSHVMRLTNGLLGEPDRIAYLPAMVPPSASAEDAAEVAIHKAVGEIVDQHNEAVSRLLASHTGEREITSAMKEAGARVIRGAGIENGSYDIAHEVLAAALALPTKDPKP